MPAKLPAIRVRADVGPAEVGALAALAAAEAPWVVDTAEPADPAPYAAVLARIAPVARIWAGPAFRFPDDIPEATGAVLITAANAALLEPHLPAWLPDVHTAQPMVVCPTDGAAAAVCGSVRRTPAAHEAGVETARAFRGRGYAARAVAAWARAVRAAGAVPLYSTSWENRASRALARRLGLIAFGSDLHLT